MNTLCIGPDGTACCRAITEALCMGEPHIMGSVSNPVAELLQATVDALGEGELHFMRCALNPMVLLCCRAITEALGKGELHIVTCALNATTQSLQGHHGGAGRGRAAHQLHKIDDRAPAGRGGCCGGGCHRAGAADRWAIIHGNCVQQFMTATVEKAAGATYQGRPA